MKIKIQQQPSQRNYSAKLTKCKNMIRKAKVRNEKKIAREAKINNRAFFKCRRNKRSVQEPRGPLQAGRGNLSTEHEDIAAKYYKVPPPTSLPLFPQRKMGTDAGADINFPGVEKRHIGRNQDRVSTGDQEIRMSENCPKSRDSPETPGMRDLKPARPKAREQEG